MRFRCILIFIISSVFLFSAGNYVPGQIIIQLKHTGQEQSNEIEQIRQDLPHLNITESRLLSRRMGAWLINFDTSRSTAEAAIIEFNSHPLIRISQLNHFVQERETYPNDPDFANQWHLENTGQSGGLEDADIDAPAAWDISTGGVTALGDTIVLAIIDSGNYIEHEDLNFWKNNLEIPGNEIDDDNNGYIDDFDGWNAVDHNGSITTSSHGTHVSGIAGAIGNNNIGVSGINWNARIMPVRGSSSTESVVVEAYGYVLEMRSRYNETGGAEGAFVVATNASFGVNHGDPDNFPIWSAIYDSLGMQGVLSCGATMNSNEDVDLVGDMPTACNSDFLIAVTNTTDEDLKNNGAAYGLTTIDLGAPGTNIYSTDLPNYGSYSYKTGTSMACPQVTGAIGFLFSAAPASFMQNYLAQPAEYALLIKQYILDGTDPVEDLDGITVTGGRLNINNSLEFFDWGPGPFEVSGNISFDMTWEADTVHVIGDVIIEEGATVTIPAGTRVQFENYYNIEIHGALLAEGTETDSIRFTAADTTGFFNPYLTDGSWNGLSFIEVGADNVQSIFSHCIFEYGKAIVNYQPVEGACLEIINSPEILISNSSFQNNFAGYGGAIYCVGSELIVQNSVFSDNIAAFSGGAIFADNCELVTIESSNFNNNLALQGGALYISGSSPELYENEFTANTTRIGQDSAGGALYLNVNSSSILNNIFDLNSCSGKGGAIFLEGDSGLSHYITKNRFRANAANSDGGTLYIHQNSNLNIINNLICESSSYLGNGGAINMVGIQIALMCNNTLADNHADNGNGVGLYCHDCEDIESFNNIYWDTANPDSLHQIALSYTTINFQYDNIQNGLQGISHGDSVEYNCEALITTEPEFSGIGDHPYELLITSGSINTGTPDTAGLGLPEFDLAGNPRVYEGYVTNIDIGAYEFQGDTSASEEDEIPAGKPLILSIYPNPFNPSTTISFSLTTSLRSTMGKLKAENTELCIYNIKGQKVKRLLINCHPEFIEGAVYEMNAPSPSTDLPGSHELEAKLFSNLGRH